MEKGIMLKRIILSIGMLYFISTNFANASPVSTFYFQTSNFEEVRVEVWGSSNDPQFVFYNDVGMDNSQLFRRYVEAGLDRLIYVYVEDICGLDCNISLGEGEKDRFSSAISSGDVSTLSNKKKAYVGASSVATKFIEGAVTQLGARSTDLVLNALTSNRTATNSPYTIITMDTLFGKRPSLMCRMVDGACHILNDVTFTSLENGWQAVFPAPEAGTPDSAHKLNINTTIVNYVITVSVACKTVYTGSPGNQKAQIVCYDPR